MLPSLQEELGLPNACNLIPGEATTFLFSWFPHGTGPALSARIV